MCSVRSLAGEEFKGRGGQHLSGDSQFPKMHVSRALLVSTEEQVEIP